MSTLLAKLSAAGVTGKHSRPLADIERELRIARELVRRLSRERKGVVNRAGLEARRRSPEFVKRLREGVARAWADPETAEKRKERHRETMRKSGWLLPDMTTEQRRRYNVLRQKKSRAEALAGVFGDRP